MSTAAESNPGAAQVDFVVQGSVGQEVGTFRLRSGATCAELKVAINDKIGVPCACQRLVLGEQALADADVLSGGEPPASVDVNLLLVIPRCQHPMLTSWKCMDGSSGFLEDLRLREVSSEEAAGNTLPAAQERFQEHWVPARKIGCVGLDPDSGLLAIVGAGAELESKGKSKGKGKDQGNDSDSDGKGKGGPKGKGDEVDSGKDKGGLKGKGKGRGDDSDSDGKGKGGLKGKGDEIDDGPAGGKDKGGLKGKGKGQGDDSDSDGKGKGCAKGKGDDMDAGAVGGNDKRGSKGKGKGQSDDSDSDGKGKGCAKGKGDDIDTGAAGAKDKGGFKGKGKSKCTYMNDTRSSVLVLPPGADPFFLDLERNHAIITAVEMHIAACKPEFPFPSLGVGVAIATGDAYRNTGPLRLYSFELCPSDLYWTQLSNDDADCEAVCLDRGATPPRVLAAELRPDGKRAIVFRQLRAGSSGVHLDEFCASSVGLAAKRVTSIAWCPASAAVLLTCAGEHAVRIYRKAVGGWEMASLLGDPESRGCQDGPASEVRFWFPSLDEKLVEVAYGALGCDSCPLLPGPQGTIFVYSGGVLMSLASDLSSAHKVTSMREELWMMEDDEGTPTFPAVGNAFGVHQGKVYRRLCRTDYTEEVLIRRLEISDQLRQGRSSLRRTATRIWPNITENGRWDIGEKGPDYYGVDTPARPRLCHEEDRDKWDGNSRWLHDEWL